ncbi:hypothetical protein LCGC14_2336110, partial [marine sediment metagenome]
MSGTSTTSSQASAQKSCTRSAASVDGLLPLAWPDGPPTGRSGPEVAPASRSAQRASVKASPTAGTFGLFGSVSSKSVSLQLSLANRLRVALDVNGSPEYALTWSEWDMESGPPICALRASGHRTSGSGCTGWPTCKARDHKGVSIKKDCLNAVAKLAGWPTPDASAMNDGERLESFQKRQARLKMEYDNGNGAGMP